MTNISNASDAVPLCDTAYKRLMKENEKLRLRLENFEKVLSEASPETEGLSLEARVNAIVAKFFETQSRMSRLKSTLRQVRETLTGEHGTLINKAKSLIDMYTFVEK